MTQELEREKIREELISLETENLQQIYRKLATTWVKTNSEKIKEEVVIEILDERQRRKDLTELSTSTLQTMHARIEQNKGDKSDDMTLDERLISEILAERSPVPPEVSGPLFKSKEGPEISE